MDRLTERTPDGILVKEDYGENALATLYACYGTEPNPYYGNYDDGYCAMERLAEYEDLGVTPEQLRQIDGMYADRCREIAELRKMLGKAAGGRLQ